MKTPDISTKFRSDGIIILEDKDASSTSARTTGSCRFSRSPVDDRRIAKVNIAYGIKHHFAFRSVLAMTI